MTAALEELFGPTLQTKDGNKPTSEVLNGCEAVGIYFSAHWCPPCRKFTPVLAKTYEDLRSQGKKFEIVFASSDKDQSQFDNYYNNVHPWTAIPFADRDRKNSLSKKYKVSGIPSLVIIDGKTGETITTKGRSVVSQPEKFPWIPLTLSESLGKTFVSSKGETITAESLEQKYLALYFSAHWCPPCKSYTPKLVSTYNKMKERSVDNFELVFISSDRDESSFKEYFSEMPWLALPFENRAAKEELSERLKVDGIPSLVILGPEEEDGSGKKNRKIINADARGLVANDPDGLKFPWLPPVFAKLEDADFINETPTVVVLAEGCDDEGIDETKKELEAAAEKLADKEGVKFAFAEPGDKLADRIRAMTKIGAPTDDVEVLLVDIADNGAFFRGEKDKASADDIAKLIADWKSKAITRQQL